MQNKDMLIFEVHNEDNSIFYMVQNMDIWIFKIYNEDNTILYKVYNREMLEFANLQILTDANYSTLIMKKNLYFSCAQSCLFLDFASIKTEIRHLTFPIKTNTIFYIMLHIESLTCENSKFCIMQNIDIYIFEIHNENNSIFHMVQNIETLTMENFQVLHYPKYRRYDIWRSE